MISEAGRPYPNEGSPTLAEMSEFLGLGNLFAHLSA